MVHFTNDINLEQAENWTKDNKKQQNFHIHKKKKKITSDTKRWTVAHGDFAQTACIITMFYS